MKSVAITFNIIITIALGIGLLHKNISAAKCPCDFYADAGTPCVAAHSTVRALYSSYKGPLYQVLRKADSATMDIGVLSQGGFANTALQDSFLNGKQGVIQKVYDQSSQHNDVTPSPPGGFMPKGGNPSSATLGKAYVSGHKVFGLYFTNSYASTPPADQKEIGYRNNNCKGLATGDQAEAMYMVVDGKRYTTDCCMNYGNAETTPVDKGAGTMECVNFSNNTSWGGTGQGNGPWVMADLENGIFKGDKGGFGDNSKLSFPQSKSIIADFATCVLKGPSGNHFTLKGGDAQKGRLTTMWDSIRPIKDTWGLFYSPKKLEGAIIIGTGGDNGNGGTGTFFEGAITIGNPPSWVDDSIQANVVAARYGDSTVPVSASYNADKTASHSIFKVNYNLSDGSAMIIYTMQDPGHVSMNVFNQQGRRIAVVVNGMVTAGQHKSVWNTKQLPPGVYVWKIALDGRGLGTGKIVVGK